MLVLGLTGGIASGKSTLSKHLANDKDISIVDADKIAREIVYPGKPAYKKILQYFGPKIPNLVSKDGSLDRRNLGSYVFQNKAELGVLNGITHPQVRWEMFKEMIWAYLSFKRIVLLDVPLLFEAKMGNVCGSIIVVTSDHDLKMERLRARNPELSSEECESRINAQMSDEEKSALADVTIANNGTKEEFGEKIDFVISTLKPSKWWTMLSLFPLIGGLSAAYYLVQRWRHMKQIKDKAKET
ncbi:BA75_04860T0 [Komagataella pastoris]|uniref:BA75_04860T0 n=1 Tax=Komagataella pastoris TaxID=4922 RepID=A0A1B2JI87_PICPA|nr:BA75_04860T0 [Komagataella pastoris]